ncbi:MAG: hypothetical protein ACK5PS_04700 [Desulfopila sp.]
MSIVLNMADWQRPVWSEFWSVIIDDEGKSFFSEAAYPVLAGKTAGFFPWGSVWGIFFKTNVIPYCYRNSSLWSRSKPGRWPEGETMAAPVNEGERGGRHAQLLSALSSD